MTSSLEGEGGFDQKMTCNDMILAKPMISWVISNLNIETAAELKNIHQRPRVRCFVVDQFLSPFTLTKGGLGSRKMT